MPGSPKALDELRAEFAHAERLVAERQGRLGQLYDLLNTWDRHCG